MQPIGLANHIIIGLEMPDSLVGETRCGRHVKREFARG